MLDTLGKRLKCCRSATGKTPQQVVSYVHKCGISLSYATYTRWESGNCAPRRKENAFLFIRDFFKIHGLPVNLEWLLTGQGFPPQFVKYRNIDEATLFILISRNILDAELLQVAGTYGEPFVKYGDFCILSTNNNVDSNHNNLCYIKTTHSISIGILTILNEGAVCLANDTSIIIEKTQILECKKVKWIQKK